MNNIYITSDLHISHNKDFIYKARGFNSVQEMNEAIVNNFNSIIDDNDIVYNLGDIYLNDEHEALRYLLKLKGRWKFIRGNHDTDNKVKAIQSLLGWKCLGYATVIKVNKQHYYLSHYPTICGNYTDTTLKSKSICLCGHNHTTDRFCDMDKGLIYHCEVDAHACSPILLEDILQDIKNYKINEGD
jgi:calcineurin-like phosphoesterase family protein